MTAPLPLSHLKVLDVSQVMAGPFCCMLLGDMGADVVKVEPPRVGDQTRRSMGFRLKGADSGGFLALNRNKRSIEIDLKSEAGLEAFYELVRDRRRADREQPARRRRPPEDRLPGAAEDQPAPGLRQHLRLRPDRSLVGSAPAST